MLLQDSKKHQPEFDLAKAQRIYTAGGHDRKLGGEWITSPYDLFSVETLRDRFDLRGGRAVPTDVFVFGKGEPPRARLHTYWWPALLAGRPKMADG